MPELDGSIELAIEHEEEVAKREVVRPEDPPKPFSLDLGPLTIDLALGANNELGEVTAKGTITLDSPIGGGKVPLADIDEVLFRYAPTHGSVGGRPEPNPPVFDDREFGRSRMSSKNVTRIMVEERERLLADVGRVCKRELWDDCPDWVFNTVACVGEFDERGRGSYSNPTSVWFNVFLGYYQIDAPKPDWKRPFAYEKAAGSRSTVRFDELVRLGKSDWNYFSNWMYGVPGEIASRHNDLDLSNLKTKQQDGGRVGDSDWHRVSIANIGFVSAYESNAHGAARLVRNSLVSDLWRKAFGQPSPHPDFRESFIPARLDADTYMAYWEDDEAFHTVLFGGTAPTGTDRRFLAGQMSGAAKVIKRFYPELGFKSE